MKVISTPFDWYFLKSLKFIRGYLKKFNYKFLVSKRSYSKKLAIFWEIAKSGFGAKEIRGFRNKKTDEITFFG